MSKREIPDSAGFFLSGGKVGVLFIHGFGGSPVSVAPWANALHSEGFTVSVPRLPGHGTSWMELNQTSHQNWFETVNTAFDEISKNCDYVFVAGFSMGGALALRLAQIRGSEIEGLLLINPVVHDRRFVMTMVPLLQIFLPSLSGGPSDVAAPNPPQHSYQRIPLKALHSARKFWQIVERDLYLVDVPMMIGYSPQDHVVDPINSETIIDNVSSIDIREVIFEKSFHNVALDYDAAQLNNDSLTFIQDVLSGEIGGTIANESELETDLVRAEFAEIVANLDVTGTDYLDVLEESSQVESKLERALYENPGELPKLKRRNRNAIISILLGSFYIAGIKISGFDPLGFDLWPGLFAICGGGVALFLGINSGSKDGDGSAL